MTDELINLLPEDLRDDELAELKIPDSKGGNLAYHQPQTTEAAKPSQFKSEPKTESFLNRVQPMVNHYQSSEKSSVNSNQNKPINSMGGVQVAKPKAAVVFSEPKKMNKSPWFGFLLRWFSIKPNASALDKAVGQDSGNLNFDVNLVPQSAYYVSVKILLLKLLLGGVIVIFFISIAHLGFILLNRTAAAEIATRQEVLSKNQASLQTYRGLAQQLNQLEVQSKSINGLINQHIYWTEFLSKLESLTLPSIYYSGMSADPKGQISLQVLAPTYIDAVQQIIFWQKQSEIKEVSFSGLSSNAATGEVSFSVKLTVEPAIFYKK